MENLEQLWNNLLDTAVTMGLFTLALWIIYFADTVFFKSALRRRFALQPRTRFDPFRLLLSPFFHVDRGHLFANTIPFFVLGSLVLIQGQVTFWLTTAIVVVVAGLGIWLFGKTNTAHVGASGLILGYFGFLLANALFNPDVITIIIAVVVAVLYLGLITQIVPLKKGVSTTGHLFGFLGGVLGAFLAAL